MRNFKFFYFLFFIFFYCSAHSENQNLVFHGAYTFETYPGQKACAVYVSIFNNTKKKFTINGKPEMLSVGAEQKNMRHTILAILIDTHYKLHA